MLDLMSEVTRILSAIEKGDTNAAGELLPLVYEELRKLAAQKMAQEAPGQTLQPTALVHEAYVRLVGGEHEAHWDNRGHFFAAAAEAMRRILVENARHKKRDKHGGGRRRVDLPDLPAADQEPEDLLALDDALATLAEEDPAAAAVVKLRLYTGLSVEEAAEALGLSRAHAYRHWTYARAWLRAALGDASGEP
jgi:RNA polymerase sigma factor (TIGR02999 family)